MLGIIEEKELKEFCELLKELNPEERKNLKNGIVLGKAIFGMKKDEPSRKKAG